MASGEFMNASEARDKALGSNTDVLTEINAIQLQIALASDDGALSVLVGPSTPVSTIMTASTVYYNSWYTPANYTEDENETARSRMNEVLGYFQKLGYSIKRTRYQSTSTFDWEISW